VSHVQIFIPRVLYYRVSNIFLFNPLNSELNPICHLLALLGAHHVFHVSRISVKYTQNYDLKDGYVYISNGTMAVAFH